MKDYGIRLRDEDNMCWSEFSSALSGLGSDNALGRIVEVRSCDDEDVLQYFSPSQLNIRREWRNRYKTDFSNLDKEKEQAIYNDVKNMFSLLAQ